MITQFMSFKMDCTFPKHNIEEFRKTGDTGLRYGRELQLFRSPSIFALMN